MSPLDRVSDDAIERLALTAGQIGRGWRVDDVVTFRRLRRPCTDGAVVALIVLGATISGPERRATPRLVLAVERGDGSHFALARVTARSELRAMAETLDALLAAPLDGAA